VFAIGRGIHHMTKNEHGHIALVGGRTSEGRSFFDGTLVSALALATALQAAPAFGQVPATRAGPAALAPEAAGEGAPAADIIVTGSRIARRDLTADTPIVTVGADRLLSTGQATLERSLGQLPQFGLGENSSQTGFGTTGQASLNMRSLGSARNLVLLDGRRLQPSNIQQVVDINTLPLPLLESVEVITGGASAAYGSDAIAGVVNFRTRKDFEGVQLDATYSLTGEGDGAVRDFSGSLGGNSRTAGAMLSCPWATPTVSRSDIRAVPSSGVTKGVPICGCRRRLCARRQRSVSSGAGCLVRTLRRRAGFGGAKLRSCSQSRRDVVQRQQRRLQLPR
jgi:hypothetical protein